MNTETEQTIKITTEIAKELYEHHSKQLFPSHAITRWEDLLDIHRNMWIMDVIFVLLLADKRQVKRLDVNMNKVIAGIILIVGILLGILLALMTTNPVVQ